MMKAFVSESPRSNALKYLLYTPDGYGEDADITWPLVVFLHGGGQSGSDLERVSEHGIPKRIRKGERFPFLVLAPQNPRVSGFIDDHAVMALIDEVTANYRVDLNRIHLTGMSRGGEGAWRLAMNNPDCFASLTVVCGATAPHVYASWIQNIPIRIYHGSADAIVPVSVAEEMASALRAVGAEVHLTLYPDVEHNAWDMAYGDPELYAWMLERHR